MYLSCSGQKTVVETGVAVLDLRGRTGPDHCDHEHGMAVAGSFYWRFCVQLIRLFMTAATADHTDH